MPARSTLNAWEAERLQAELQPLRAELDCLEAENARLEIERSERRPPFALRIFGSPLQRHEIQSLVVNNLRQIMAARDQYQLENGRPPAALSDLVGPRGYIRYLNRVDGEDYASLPLGPDANFTVTTQTGITIGYHGGGPPLPEEITRIDWPPELARLRALREKIAEPKQAAREAYRFTHQGYEPPSEQDLLPYFSSAELGADFAEYLDAQKAARLNHDIFHFK